jgi:hypothetical protein
MVGVTGSIPVAPTIEKLNKSSGSGLVWRGEHCLAMSEQTSNFKLRYAARRRRIVSSNLTRSATDPKHACSLGRLLVRLGPSRRCFGGDLWTSRVASLPLPFSDRPVFSLNLSTIRVGTCAHIGGGLLVGSHASRLDDGDPPIGFGLEQ